MIAKWPRAGTEFATQRPSGEEALPSRAHAASPRPLARTHDTNTKRKRNQFPGLGATRVELTPPKPPIYIYIYICQAFDAMRQAFVPGKNARHICQAYMPGIHTWHACLEYMPGVYAWRVCPAYVPGINAWHVCRAYVPSIYAGHTCQAYMPSIYARHKCRAYVPGIHCSPALPLPGQCEIKLFQIGKTENKLFQTDPLPG